MMASLARRRSAWDWRTRLKWFPSILGIKVLVEHRRHHVLVAVVGFEYRRPQWRFEFCEDHRPHARAIDDGSRGINEKALHVVQRAA